MAVVLLAFPAQAQLRFSTYLSEVGKTNPSLTAQRATLPLADAQTIIARVFPDPVLTAGLASLDVTNVGAQNNITASVTVPFEWPGKRSARITFSEANRSVAGAEFEDFARLVRAQAAHAYIDAVFARRVVDQKRAAVESLHKVVGLNEKRLQEGASSEIVVLQARVEARRFEGELVTALGEARALRLLLEEQMGQSVAARSPLEDVAELELEPRTFDADALVAGALERRPDHLARTLAIDAATAQLGLARANRGPDVSVGLGWLHYTPGTGAYAAPAYETVSALLSVPLPFSKLYDGEVRSADAQQRLAAAQREANSLRIEAEVRTALIRYEAARERLSQFDQALLGDSDRLLEMARYSFEQGASRLVELLSAQRSWIDLHLAYESARADHAHALVALEAAAGVWTLE